jgi:tRNA (cytidine/uridine-2'-O-)-methyltransferase
MLKVVLFQPQIPPNTGTIARTCAATHTPLHLIHPIGFKLDNTSLKRAGINYWHLVDITQHASWEDFKTSRKTGRLIGFSPAGTVAYHKFKFQEGDWMLHGREADGLPLEIQQECDYLVYIPMLEPGVRSLNLSVSAGIALYHALSALDGI